MEKVCYGLQHLNEDADCFVNKRMIKYLSVCLLPVTLLPGSSVLRKTNHILNMAAAFYSKN